jgi:hypothetical protein
MRTRSSCPTQLLWGVGATGLLAFGCFVTIVSPSLTFSAQPAHHLVLLYAATLPLFQLVYRWEFLVWIRHVPVFLLFLREITSGKTFKGARAMNHTLSL